MLSPRPARPEPAEVLLVLPPISDLTTCYPSTGYLAGYLRSRGARVAQVDWSLELAYRLFSRVGLELLADRVRSLPVARLSAAAHFFLEQTDSYLATVEPVIGFLAGNDRTVEMRIEDERFLPAGPHLRAARADVGSDSVGRAQHLASLYLCDLEAVVRDVDPGFRLSAYAEQLAASPESFAPLRRAVDDDSSFLGSLIDAMVDECLPAEPPRVVGLSVPFPGNVFGAFRIARRLRRWLPETRVALGGGWVNTELRDLSDPAVFDYVDYISLDDGERPVECLLEHARGERGDKDLLRTFVRRGEEVVFCSSAREADPPFRENVAPVYGDLPLDRYLAWSPGRTRVHRVWSGRWNKLTLAHGCYWRKCTFCDISLDYIRRYEGQGVEQIVDHVEHLIEETGTTGFHWVDEAAPPALLRRLSEALIERHLRITWWSMIRFEKAFDRELAELMAAAGCVMLSGGLEVASDRILRLIDKGVSIESVARTTKALSAAGIQVHAFLMYGFPSQTMQETVDSLEVVRQLFSHGCVDSAFWHRFVATVHSPVGINPDRFGIRISRRPSDDPPPGGLFATDVLDFEDPVATDHATLGRGLERAVTAYREGHELRTDVREWFGASVPAPTVPPDRIANALRGKADGSHPGLVSASR